MIAAERDVQRYVPAVQPGDPHDIRWSVFALPLALLAACGLTLYRLRAALHQVRDTRGFQDALRAWTPLVQRHRVTPRAIKRFGNRIRYLAMLHQAERLDESSFDTLRRVRDSTLAWVGRRIPAIRPWRSSSVAAHHEGANLDMAVENIVALVRSTSALDRSGGIALQEAILATHNGRPSRRRSEGRRCQAISSSGPLPKRELDSFEASLRGIRTPST
jgi:hypothetical protein